MLHQPPTARSAAAKTRAARQRQVRRDAALIGEEDERRGAVGDHVANHAVLLLERGAIDPVREIVRRILLEEALGVDAVGKAVHAERAVAIVGQRGRADAPAGRRPRAPGVDAAGDAAHPRLVRLLDGVHAGARRR